MTIFSTDLVCITIEFSVAQRSTIYLVPHPIFQSRYAHAGIISEAVSQSANDWLVFMQNNLNFSFAAGASNQRGSGARVR